MIIAGHCLLNNEENEISGLYRTAEALAKIDKSIVFRTKLWGGGTVPERVKWGIGEDGIKHLLRIHNKTGLTVSCEIQHPEQFKKINSQFYEGGFIPWVGARNSQNYILLKELEKINNEIIIVKRGAGMTTAETIGIHDIAKDIGFKEVYIIERGINTFCRTDVTRWMPDILGMIHIKLHRPDINIMFDPTHSTGHSTYIDSIVKATTSIGIENYMIECYANVEDTQTDVNQAISIEQFKDVYKIIKKSQ